MSTKIQQGIYRDRSGMRVDVIGIATLDDTTTALVVYRVIDERRELRACEVEGFEERFTLVQSNQDGPR